MSSIDEEMLLEGLEDEFDEFDDFDETEEVAEATTAEGGETAVDFDATAGFDDFDFDEDDGFEEEPATAEEEQPTFTAPPTITEVEQSTFTAPSVETGDTFDFDFSDDDTDAMDIAVEIPVETLDDSDEEPDFNFGGVQADETQSLFDTMNEEDSWTTDVQLGEETALNEDVVADAVADAVDKSSFDGLFLDRHSATPASTGVHTSVLEGGACDNSAFSLKYINVKDIIVWTPRIRGNTDITALTTSIKNDGLLQPLVVAPTKTEGRYVLIKGSRRLLACATLGMKNIPCVINSQISNSDIHVVEPIYSHTRPYSVSEMLNFIEYIKKEKGIDNPSMIEYLLNMDSGVYMKLMDVMDDNDDEIVSALLTGEIDIKTAYKKLEQKRKKEGRDKMADARANKIYGDASYGTDITANSGETNADGEQLTDKEIRDIVDGVGDLDNVDNIDGEELRQQGDNMQGFTAHRQDPNERERLDPKLRKSVLARDNNTCRICGMGGQEYPEVLDVHHIVEVYLGGNDDINNLMCACTVCHKLVHLWGRGELQVRPFDQMDEAEANKFKRIIKLGNVIREGMAAKGMKKEQLKKLDQADTIGRRLKGSSDQVAG